ncbi:MAG: lactate utilization protein [Desulfobacterales bacterium]
MTTRTEFIRRVTAALGYTGPPEHRRAMAYAARPGSEAARIVKRVRARTDADRSALLQQLITQGKPLNLTVIPKNGPGAVATSIAELAAQKVPEWDGPKSVAVWCHPLIDRLGLPEILAPLGIPVDAPPRAPDDLMQAHAPAPVRRRLASGFIGVTSADFCLAETGTLVMKTVPGHERSISLLPSLHVAVIDIGQIILNLAELYAVLRHDGQPPDHALTNCLTLISGPSKTADIELTMVHGAHGPRELHLFVITPPPVSIP